KWLQGLENTIFVHSINLHSHGTIVRLCSVQLPAASCDVDTARSAQSRSSEAGRNQLRWLPPSAVRKTVRLSLDKVFRKPLLPPPACTVIHCSRPAQNPLPPSIPVYF